MPVLSTAAGLHEILALLTAQLRPDANLTAEIGFLTEVFSEHSFNSLMKIHQKLQQFVRQGPTPALQSAAALAEDISEELQSGQNNNDMRELMQLLAKPHIQAVLSAHDTVARKAFDPVLPPMPDDLEVEEEEESMKIVRLVKNKEPLGATIRMDEQTGAVVVARIMRGGAADRSGLVHVGDELREVNEIPVEHKTPEEISQILAQCQGSITLKLIPAVNEEDQFNETKKALHKAPRRRLRAKVHVRALFDYDPSEDKAIPCKEAGLPFRKGDVLQVVSQDDSVWWQAKRVGDANLRAGLIPSKKFQEKRLAYRQKKANLEQEKRSKRQSYDQSCEKDDCDCDGYLNGLYIAGLRRSFRLSRKDRHANQNEEKQTEQKDVEYLTYEEVVAYHRRPNDVHRLVVLVGSIGAKANEMRQRIVAENPNRYNVAVPSTTRQKKIHERQGLEYHFVSKLSFEADIQKNRFVEHGEYKDNLYGINVDSIRSIMLKKKICLLDANPETIKNLRTAEFKPFVIFVKPFLQEPKASTSTAETSGNDNVKELGEDKYQEMVQSAAYIEEQYGHLIDKVLVKGDLQTACSELRTILESIERDTFWVPASWVRS
ncbi:MAGUK p55 subfamily member 3-like isoform X2 [Stegostoma tigrinum]|uniref:MAGUK p55 subfamily member 3-like isoform X2 n=1 Tax=Stegostoma tigrinum TaxID=3053191 RepID=UPI00202B19C3|nr:MAGUK p55 subfamily member 3-like isoform X2 [Stegostoma tigrinum]